MCVTVVAMAVAVAIVRAVLRIEKHVLRVLLNHDRSRTATANVGSGVSDCRRGKAPLRARFGEAEGASLNHQITTGKEWH